MRSFMTVPCDMFFTMDMKVKSFLGASMRVLGISEKKIDEAIEFVSKFDFKRIADQVIGNMLAFLESKT